MSSIAVAVIQRCETLCEDNNSFLELPRSPRGPRGSEEVRNNRTDRSDLSDLSTLSTPRLLQNQHLSVRRQRPQTRVHRRFQLIHHRAELRHRGRTFCLICTACFIGSSSWCPATFSSAASAFRNRAIRPRNSSSEARASGDLAPAASVAATASASIVWCLQRGRQDLAPGHRRPWSRPRWRAA